ncbi:MAG: CDP-alcohol phosphatidyltransferase family protein [Pseudomonadota bacterium]
MSHNTWLHRLVRIGVIPLVNTPVTPNQITTLRLLTGVACAALFALGPAWHLYAALLFVVSMLLDRADGVLARITGKTTPWGHRYDLFSDGFSNALVFIGIGVGLRDSALGLWSIPMGFLAGLAVAMILWLVVKVERLEGQRAAELGNLAGFDPDDAMLVVPLAVILGWAKALLMAAAIGAPAFAIFMGLHFRSKLRNPSS